MNQASKVVGGRVEVVANTASGSVGPNAPAELEQILSEAGVQARICAPPPEGIMRGLEEAVATRPDLLIVLAGDGTARAAAELCGPTGPTLAPLPGGTMNMLPHAIYGERPWQDALRLMLDQGEELMLGGGQVESHRFLVAAILGSPALWAPAREAARHGKLGLAFSRAHQAFNRAFSGRLRYAINDGPRLKTEALTFMCPLISRILDEEEPVLEAAALDVRGAGDAFRLGLHFLTGDWRDDPAVAVARTTQAKVWAAHHIPALLDGESVRLRQSTEVRYVKEMVRVLALPRDLRT